MSTAEIEHFARRINQNYRPRYACMLLRLRNAWERTRARGPLLKGLDLDDPLAGLPPTEIFGDPNTVAVDAARFPGLEDPLLDIFATGRLGFAEPSHTSPIKN
jgi:hypothetical protein